MGKSKGRLFLLELVIIILFFSIAAAVCATMFAKAKILGNESADLAAAVMLVQETAETFRATGKLPESEMFYDAEFKPLENAEGAVYVLNTWIMEKDGLLSAHLSVAKNGAGLFSVDTARYGGPAYEG
ncbi:type IV pilus modification PilV family protein [Christensenella tenuis]|uniref:Type II secretion system protein n=1 Tax=Christensenella tenuis TaxID=2763033 RepID=A0ABR7EGZ5_9FIRM|nr:hypothetical protein [Christensenella tenuis]MBC5649027.1 hypothetical protein [Christensenella tenuis]